MTRFRIYISSHGEARSIKFGKQVNLIQRIPLGTLPQEVVMSLPINHVTLTNLFIFSYRGILLANLGSKNNSFDRSSTPPWLILIKF